MNYINLIEAFDREIEVLEICDTSMIYAIDQKNEVMDVCHIGRYDFESGEKERLAVLDYTRIYESFQTYSQSRDFFYAVNVLQDYRLRLRRINKTTWSPEGELIIEALGEILNLFIIDDQYLLIIDEVKKTDERIDMYPAFYTDDTYVNVCYLYDCFSKKRYPVTDRRLHGFLDAVTVYETGAGGDPYLVFAVHCGEDGDEAKTAAQESAPSPSSAVYYMERQAFIAAITGRRPLFLEEICVSDASCKVWPFDNDRGDLMYRLRDTEAGTEKIIACDLVSETSAVIRSYPYEEGRYFYDPWDFHVYHVPDDDAFWLSDDEACEKHVQCVTDPDRSFVYSSAFGTFSGVCRQDMFLTTFYKEVMAKTCEFHEYTAVHDLKTPNRPQVFEGRFVACRDKVILLKTFLAL